MLPISRDMKMKKMIIYFSIVTAVPIATIALLKKKRLFATFETRANEIHLIMVEQDASRILIYFYSGYFF